ncbi:hypothetical protein BJ165DRAFT_329724 [Panaeolus papilionaceus]|nr:hypothetical protein BJ165DRAFT_329724 [Panaeolus papilionaceus]
MDPSLVDTFITHTAPSRRQPFLITPPQSVSCNVLPDSLWPMMKTGGSTASYNVVVGQSGCRSFSQVVVPLPSALVLVDEVIWVLYRATELLPAATIRRINGPERRWRVPSFEKFRSLFHGSAYMRSPPSITSVYDLQCRFFAIALAPKHVSPQHHTRPLPPPVPSSPSIAYTRTRMGTPYTLT